MKEATLCKSSSLESPLHVIITYTHLHTYTCICTQYTTTHVHTYTHTHTHHTYTHIHTTHHTYTHTHHTPTHTHHFCCSCFIIDDSGRMVYSPDLLTYLSSSSSGPFFMLNYGTPNMVGIVNILRRVSVGMGGPLSPFQMVPLQRLLCGFPV